MTKRIISPSPHLHSGNRSDRLMLAVALALLPALATGVWFFGIRALMLTLTAVTTCMVTEYITQRFMLKQPPTLSDGSAIVTGVIFSLNLPSNLPLWIVIIGAFVSIAIGKMSFGGLGRNIFNPALVGRVFLLISFPVQMTAWPLPEQGFMIVDGETGATLLSALKHNPELHPDLIPLLTGNLGGSLGETGAVALLIGALFLLFRRVITWHIPVSIIVSAFITSALFHWIDPAHNIPPHYHLLVGGLLLGAIFMATDYVTSPMTPTGMLLYGCGIGIITILIRTFGAYPEGISFAILIMNALTPLINHYVKPRYFGGGKKQ